MPDLDPTHVILLTGVDPDPPAAAMLALVAVRHHIDVDAQVLHRVVSDITGVPEREQIPLDHACTSCALREDVLPTPRRLADDGRWATIVAQLPVGAGADQVCHVLSIGTRGTWARRTPHTHLSFVGTGSGPAHLTDSFGDRLLAHDEVWRPRHCQDGFEQWLGPIRTVA